MKICFVSYEYPPLQIGGGGVYAVNLSQELAKLGHEVHVFSANLNKKTQDCLEAGVFIHRIPILNANFLKNPSFWFNVFEKYRKIILSQGQFDIHHGNGPYGGFSLSSLGMRGRRVVTIHHLVKTSAFQDSSSRIFNFRSLGSETGLPSLLFEKYVKRKSDKFIVVSNFTKKDLISTYGINAENISVIYNGVYVDDFVGPKKDILKAKNALNLSNHTVFLFVGRVDDPRKDLFLLLRAWKILLKTTPSIRLLIVGGGDQTSAKALAMSLEIFDTIIFTGYISDSSLKEIYCLSDVFVSSSTLEGFGLTIVEAMAAGKPS